MLLDAARSRSTTLYVTSQVLCEFYAIVTNARRVLKPRSSADWWRCIRLEADEAFGLGPE
jgi:hypothetical protein